IVDIINDGINNIAELNDVKHVYYGKLRTLAIDYPSIIVWFEEEQANDGVKADSSRILYKDIIGIAVLEKSIEEDKGEKNALRKIVKIEELLRANPNLDGLVADEPLQAMPKRILPVNMRDFALTEVSMIITYRRWVDA
ncbi:MAG: hypothetical protein D6752_05230, partial [Candidatus Nitrosothermus koennekii]